VKAYVAVTDEEWFQFLSSRPDLEEVNFWRPSSETSFRALKPGELFLFKLRAPANWIVGGGLFGHFSRIPVSLAWDTFKERNGAPNLTELRRRIEKHRLTRPTSKEDYPIGCILLEQPFFLPRGHWIRAPKDLSLYGPGKIYDLTSESGRVILNQLREALGSQPERAAWAAEKTDLHGEPTLVIPRVGQGTFRWLVADTYQRRCAITREKVLPVLEAAHIKPVSEGGDHRIENGLLLRSDVHTLFDGGYVTVTPDFKFLVSRRLKDDFDNGEHYYRFNGQNIWIPRQVADRPSRKLLEWHADAVFMR